MASFFTLHVIILDPSHGLPVRGNSGSIFSNMITSYLYTYPPGSMRAGTFVEEDGGVKGGAGPGEGPVTALLQELESMRLNMLLKKEDLRGLKKFQDAS